MHAYAQSPPCLPTTSQTTHSFPSPHSLNHEPTTSLPVLHALQPYLVIPLSFPFPFLPIQNPSKHKEIPKHQKCRHQHPQPPPTDTSTSSATPHQTQITQANAQNPIKINSGSGADTGKARARLEVSTTIANQATDVDLEPRAAGEESEDWKIWR